MMKEKTILIELSDHSSADGFIARASFYVADH